jgi:uncharacterized caspase-like protein
MRRLAALVAALLAICFASPSAMASKRVALVIGNSNYQNAPALTNPANDAAAITEMFKQADFDVIDSRRDLKSQEMRRALRDFGDKARGADIAVVYFAGHGLEVDGSNYVVPVDAVLERDADAEDEAVSLNRILLAVEPATHLRLVILDACRDNPFAKKMKRTLASRSVGRGLVGVEANKPNTFIAFAAKEGSTALDGDGKNSPFSAALIKHLTTPGLDIRKAFGYVRDDVMSATGNQQEPYTTNSLGGSDVTLVPAPAGASAAGNNPNADIRRDYELAERVGTREAWDSFVAAHQTGFYSDLARAQRNKLAAEAAQAAATEKARAAAEAQARLAAEGAKASEQAKAAAQSKAAEDERLAAERNRQEAEKAKAIEEAKIASVPQAAPSAPRDASKDGKSAEPVVAALTPPAAPEAPKSDALPLADIPRLLQSELRRVGCKTGEIDSEWNASARKALSSFNDHAGTKFDVKLASLDALDAVKARAGRVCPLDCDRGFRADGDRCVKITCDSDQVLGPNGTCRPRPERAPKVVAHRERRSPAGHGGRCFVYNGASVCE